jgi:hypothetical protein
MRPAGWVQQMGIEELKKDLNAYKEAVSVCHVSIHNQLIDARKQIDELKSKISILEKNEESKLIAWFDANDVRGDNSKPNHNLFVSWNDKSGNNNHAYKGKYCGSPIFKDGPNNLSVLDLQGTTNLSVKLSETYTSYSIYTVQYAKGNKDWQRLLNGNIDGDGCLLYGLRCETDEWITSIGNSKWENLESNKPERKINDEWTITHLTVSGNKSFSSINGKSQTFREWNSIGGINSVMIGSAGTLGTDRLHQTWQGCVAEIMIFNGPVSYSEHYKIQGYLAWKWGLNHKLESGHPYQIKKPNDLYKQFDIQSEISTLKETNQDILKKLEEQIELNSKLCQRIFEMKEEKLKDEKVNL